MFSRIIIAEADHGMNDRETETNFGGKAGAQVVKEAGRETGARAGRETGTRAGRETGTRAGRETGTRAERETGAKAEGKRGQKPEGMWEGELKQTWGQKQERKREQKRGFEQIWAPVLISFTDWVLKEALSRNIHTLYFLARDARMPYMIACRMTEWERLPLCCRYLEGSRYAWRMAEFYLPDTEPVEKICMGGVHVTLRKMLRRGGLDNAEAEEIALLLGKRMELDAALSYADTQRMKAVLSECVRFQELLQGHAGEAYRNTIRYLRQEGMMGKEPFAIVDSGWIGSLQMTLEHLLTSAAGEEVRRIHGFYFGLYELPKGADTGRYHTYYFRPYRDIGKKARFNNCLFEAVCSAVEGMTAGYREEAGRMTPIYETRHNPNREQIIRNQSLLEGLLEQRDKVRSLILPVKEVQRLLEGLMGRPDESDIAVYGNYLFSDDVSDSSLQPVAAVLEDREIKRLHVFNRLLIMKGMKKESLKDSAWPEGSVVRAGKNTAYHLFQIRMYKRLVNIKKILKRICGKGSGG